MPSEIQIRAIARRFNRSKFLLSFFKSLFAIGATVTPNFLSIVGTAPIIRVIPVIISALGYLGYLSNEFFEYLENEDKRNDIQKLNAQFDLLIQDYTNRYGVITRAATGNVDAKNYILFNPNRFAMFGARAHDRDSIMTSLIHWVFASIAFGIAVYQEITKPDATITNPWILVSLISALLAAVVDPIEQHLKVANLGRAQDTYQDAIYAFYRSAAVRLTIGVPPSRIPAVAPAAPLPRRRRQEIGEGVSELLGFREGSGRNAGQGDRGTIANSASIALANFVYTRNQIPDRAPSLKFS